MSHTFQTSTGTWFTPDGDTLGSGYSGHGDGLNNPAMQNVPEVGPIPTGQWTIGPAYDDATKGPCVMTLTAHAETQDYERSGFLIHGDSIELAGEEQASHGCIILGKQYREAINASDDHQLVVVP